MWSLSGALGDVAPDRARTLAEGLAAAAGVRADRDGFASVPEERLLALQQKLTALDRNALGEMLDLELPLGPLVDGDLIRRPTRASLGEGIGAGKPLVLGTTDDEFTMAFSDDMTKMMDSFPLGRVSMMAGDAASPEMIEGLIAMANAGSAPASGA